VSEAAKEAGGDTMEVRIEALGGRGDGIALLADGSRLFVAGALPGERVLVRPERHKGEQRARLVTVLEGSPERVAPPCPHFGRCGGCRLQHLALPAYAKFLEQRIGAALAARGLESVPIEPVELSPPASRRRLRLAWRRVGRNVVLGLREARSPRIVDLATCLIARPALVALLPSLRALLAALGLAEGEIALEDSAVGVDVVEITQKHLATPDRIRLAAALPELAGVCRISWRSAAGRESEPIATAAVPSTQHGPIRIELVPGGFRQATDAGLAAMRRFLNRHLAGARHVLDLYGGTGALGLALDPLPARLEVVEGDQAATAMLARALGQGIRGSRVTVRHRDLERDPLQPAELRSVDAVILDPPRAGAKPQCLALGGSRVGRIGYVSCDSGSFARDARILVDGGYHLAGVQPIGQFLWSDEVELAAIFHREPA
jgi:23S rRNA (uracil1939-C5)-methyltransferase